MNMTMPVARLHCRKTSGALFPCFTLQLLSLISHASKQHASVSVLYY